MNVVDSSGWLEYFAGGPNASYFQVPIEDVDQLIVPTITIYEVYKRLLLYGDNRKADQNISLMLDARVVALESYIAVDAAETSIKLKLPMADSIILSTTRLYGATLWTQDAHFAGIAGVKYIPKP